MGKGKEKERIYFDRSRWECDQGCRRRRYWEYEYKGKGIKKEGHAFELGFGAAFHEGAALIGLGEDIDAIVAKVLPLLDPFLVGATELRIKEQRLLLEGLLRGWARSTAWDKILDTYDIISVEQELIYTGDPEFLHATKPDTLLRHKVSGKLGYLEFKTTGSLKAEWFRQWQRAPQLMGVTLAVKEQYGEDLDHIIVQPLYKGYESQYGDPHQESVFVTAWRNTGKTPVEWSGKRPQSWKGWERVSAGDIGYPAWFACIGQAEIDAAIPENKPIHVNDPIIRRWWRQATFRERDVYTYSGMIKVLEEALEVTEDAPHILDIMKSRDTLLDQGFPQNFKNCEAMYGKRACPYVDCCWIPHIEEDPLSYGYTWREPHHQTEVDLWAKREV